MKPFPRASRLVAILLGGVACVQAHASTTATSAPDGGYRCHKISPGGQLMDIGDLQIKDGQATMAGMPDGWTVLSVSAEGTNERGQTLVFLYYRSSSGFNDKLDCVPR
jgi:hypothetical protein